MADISIRVGGDSSEAQRALREVGGAAGTSAEDVGKAAVKWGLYAEAAKKAIETVVRFGVESVKAFAEAARVQAQLERVAGGLTAAFEKQADALQDALAVDGEVVKQMQTLLLQWGAAPARVEGLTKAVLDYAAATGKDALSATTEIIKAVETGGGKLEALGVTYTQTGDKTKDLAALTAALAAKFGGAAETDANSLVGRARAAEIAFGDLQEEFGSLVGEFATKTGIVDALTGALKKMRDAMRPYADSEEGRGKELETLRKVVAGGEDAYNADVQARFAATGESSVPFEQVTARLKELEALADKVAPKLSDISKGGLTYAQPKSGSTAADGAIYTSGIKLGTDEVDSQGSGKTSAWEREQEALAKQQAAFAKQMEEGQIQLWVDISKADAEGQAKQLELQKKSGDAMVAVMEDQRAKVLAMEQEWAKAGDAIGAALVNGIASQIEKLQDGGEIDAGEMVGDILAVVLAIAGTAIGTYFGAPQVGAALGGLAGTGVRALTRKRRHDGGWMDEGERFHGGGWLGPDEVPIIGQTGERVLSRAEVSRMGGRAGVDSAVAGGGGGRGGVTINVSALDALSTREFFSDRGGQGFRRAVESGRGDVARLLGAGSLY